MGNVGEDLASRLRRALLEHRVQLEPAVKSWTSPPVSRSSSSSNSQDSSDPHLAYITQMLMDDDLEDDSNHLSPAESDLLEELTSIVSIDQRYANNALSLNSATTGKLDIHEALMQCARAVTANNPTLFFQLSRELLQSMAPHPSPDPLERTAVLFIEALQARLTGTAAQAHRALSVGISTRRMLNLRLLNLPCFLVCHVFANEAILRACRGAKRIHIVDFGILYGSQWPELLHALSQREGGPPEVLKITGIDFPELTWSRQTEKRLVDFARSLNITLEYYPVASSSWELVQPAHIHPSEFLVVNCNMRLRHIKDETMATNQPRKAFFENIHKMKPDIFLQCVASVGMCSPFFISRFEEALRHFTAKMELYDTWMDDVEEHSFMERLIARSVMNAVGCEGPEYVERAEKYNVWDLRAKRAGFQPLELQGDICEKTKKVWGRYKYNKNVAYGTDENWLLLGWKDTVIFGMSAWKPSSSLSPSKSLRYGVRE